MKTEELETAWILPFELALIRWSVVCGKWNDLSSGSAPLLTPFLAGWCCRCAGASMPVDVGPFGDSLRTGWREADDHIAIDKRYKQNKP